MRADEPGPRVRTWDRGTLLEPPRLPGGAILDDDAVLEEWCSTVHKAGVAMLTGTGTEPGTVTRVAERIGPVRLSEARRLGAGLSRTTIQPSRPRWSEVARRIRR